MGRLGRPRLLEPASLRRRALARLVDDALLAALPLALNHETREIFFGGPAESSPGAGWAKKTGPEEGGASDATELWRTVVRAMDEAPERAPGERRTRLLAYILIGLTVLLTFTGGTVGQRMVDIRLVDQDGTRAGLPQVLLKELLPMAAELPRVASPGIRRSTGCLLSLAVLGLDPVWCLIDGRQRSLGQVVSGTRFARLGPGVPRRRRGRL